MNKQPNTLARWSINHPLHGRVQLIPSSVRYYKDRSHPYGWEIGFQATVMLSSGERRRDWTWSALGTDRNAAFANALNR